MTQCHIDYDRAFFGFVALIFYLFAFFPYLSILPLGSDTQPNALAVGLLILAISSRSLRLPEACWALGLLWLLAVAVLLLGPASFAGIRSVIGYASLFVISSATYVAVRNGFPIKEGLLTLVVLVWLFVGLAQRFIDPEFATFLLSSARTTEDRGVVSLAVEPGFYATMMFFVFLLLMARKKEVSILGLLCVLQIFLLAQSTVVVLAFAMLATAYALLKFRGLLKNIYFLAFLVLLFFCFPILQESLEETRIGSLVELVWDNPMLILSLDHSGSSRASAIFFSLKGAFENYLIPWGYAAYPDYVDSAFYEYRKVFLFAAKKDRIMSGYGGALFEIGALALTVPVVITVAIFRHFSKADWPHAITMNVGVHAILFTAMPFALPIIGVLIGYLLATPNRRLSRKKRAGRWPVRATRQVAREGV